MALGFLYGAGGGGASIPDGATVLPVGDVYTLQQCAGIKDPQYTTLAELLADATTLAHVIDSANAINYLVRSKTWINNDTQVPIMTSDTTPSGECFAYNPASGYSAYLAFDRNDSTYYNTDSTNAYCGYHFTSPIAVQQVYFKVGLAGRVNQFKIQHSDDGTSWTDDYSGTTATAETTVNLTGTTPHAYWRLYRVNYVGSYSQIQLIDLKFFGNSIVFSATAMSLIGANNYASDTLLADSDWCEAICDSPYFESVLNVKVPTMTSNTTPSGVVSASSVYSSSVHEYAAFDNNDGTEWHSASGMPQWIAYEFATAKIIKVVKATTLIHGGPKVSKFQGSNDNNSWTDIGNFVDVPANSNVSKTFENTTQYKKYRLYITESNYGSYVALLSLQFYGREDI